MRDLAPSSKILRTSFATLSLMLALAAARPLLAQGATHVVQRGETLSEIAVQHGTDTETLRRLNDLGSADLVFYGLPLRLPESKIEKEADAPVAREAPFGAQFHLVQRGETLSAIASAYDTTVGQLVALNQIDPDWTLFADRPILVPIISQSVAPTASQTIDMETIHIVQSGEHLGILASRYDTSALAIARANNLTNADIVVPDQRLIIPIKIEIEETPAEEEKRDQPSAAPDAYHDHTQFPTKTEKWIDVDLSEQRVVAYEGTEPVKAFIVSSGLPPTPTLQGEFRIWTKTSIQDMYGGNRAAGSYYYLEDVQWVQYFYEDYAFHGTSWHDNFGQPMSRGCINMRNEDARWLYEWAGPASTLDESGWLFSSPGDPGTLVLVHG